MIKTGVVPVFIAFVATVISCRSVEEAGDPAQEHRDLVVADSIVESSLEEGIMIGHITDVCFGPSGEVLVLDQTAACVYAFSRNGDFTGIFGGPGSGPGDIFRMGTESVVFTADSLGNVYLSEISGEDYLVTVFSPRGEIYTP